MTTIPLAPMAPATDPAGQPIRRAGTLGRVSLPADDPLLPAVAVGDVDAVGELWSRYAGRVRSLGLQLSGYDPSFGDDLVQETFARLWRSAARFDAARGTETTFVFTVARRAAVDLWRRSRRSARDRPLDEGGREWAAGPADTATGASLDGHAEASARLASDDETVDAMLTGWVVNEALATLGPAQREVIDLAYFGQLSQSEIATRLGIPLGTVKTRTFAALRALPRRARHPRGAAMTAGSESPAAEHDRLRTDLAGYVLGGLTAAEQAAVEAHLAECESCRAELTQLDPIPVLLEIALDAETASALPDAAPLADASGVAVATATAPTPPPPLAPPSASTAPTRRHRPAAAARGA